MVSTAVHRNGRLATLRMIETQIPGGAFLVVFLDEKIVLARKTSERIGKRCEPLFLRTLIEGGVFAGQEAPIDN